jgi:hypothetical protein
MSGGAVGQNDPLSSSGFEDIPLLQRAKRATRKLQESYRQAYIYSASTMAKSLGALSKSFEISDK